MIEFRYYDNQGLQAIPHSYDEFEIEKNNSMT